MPSTGTYEQLVSRVALVSRLNPKPEFLFNFAGSQACSQLAAERARIADAAGCSKDGPPCREGTLQQLHL